MPIPKSFADSLKPPVPARTPADHYHEADRLLGELDALGLQELSLAFNQMKLAKARIHAMLAQVILPEDRAIDDVPPEAIGDVCVNCSADIIRPNGQWFHKTSCRIECTPYLDRTEIATPATR